MKLNYCIECAAPLNKVTDSEYTCENGHKFWNNPLATVAVVLVRDGKILVSKRAHEPNKGLYDLPGGFLEYGESVLEGAMREVSEETGLDLSQASLRVLTAYTGFYGENESVCDIVVLAEGWQGEPVADDDSEALEWQPYDFLESKQFAPPYYDLPQLLRNNL